MASHEVTLKDFVGKWRITEMVKIAYAHETCAHLARTLIKRTRSLLTRSDTLRFDSAQRHEGSLLRVADPRHAGNVHAGIGPRGAQYL